MAEDEIDRIDPAGNVITLSGGLQVKLLRLQTRQLFRLLKILTHGGMGSGLITALDFTLPADEFVQRLVTLLLMSIPDADQETLEFLAVMLSPVGLADHPGLADAERAANQELWRVMNDRLSNPPPEDLIDLIAAIIKQEAPEFQALGKKLAAALGLFLKTGQDKETPPAAPSQQDLAAMSGVPASPASPSAAPSPPSLTPSPASTDGLTPESLTSPSAA